MQTSPRLRRSNRPVTQFAVDCITKFISNGLDDGKYINHNTTVACNVTNRDRSISVFLHETELVNLVIDRNDEPIHLSISIGSRFTPQGNPAETVIERLNGILDILGIDGIIPAGFLKTEKIIDFVLAREITPYQLDSVMLKIF